MRVILLQGKEDMEWLAETHCPIARRYELAYVEGNEDCPSKVSLFARNHYQCKPTVLIRDDNTGDLVVTEWGEKTKETP